jgi:nucleoside-diphosphate-sugar epimerase
MKVLVTGATGFLGSHIVEACLARGDTVRALVRRGSDRSHLSTLQVERVLGDLGSPETLRAATRDIDVVHHAAARVAGFGSRSAFVDANVVGTTNLLEASRASGVSRFVFVSSPSVVMDGRDQRDVNESAPYPNRYLNLYSETKAEAERRVLAASAPGFSTCALRPRAVWGPRDRTGWLPTVVAKMARRRLPDLSGGREVLASLCHAENAALACVLASRSDAVGGKAYFVTDAEKTNVWALSPVLAELFGVPPVTRRASPRLALAAAAAIDLLWKLPALGDHREPPLSRYSLGLLTRSGTYDVSAAARDFDYRPIVSQSEGLRRTKAWVDTIGGVDAFTRAVR